MRVNIWSQAHGDDERFGSGGRVAERIAASPPTVPHRVLQSTGAAANQRLGFRAGGPGPPAIRHVSSCFLGLVRRLHRLWRLL